MVPDRTEEYTFVCWSCENRFDGLRCSECGHPVSFRAQPVVQFMLDLGPIWERIVNRTQRRVFHELKDQNFSFTMESFQAADQMPGEDRLDTGEVDRAMQQYQDELDEMDRYIEMLEREGCYPPKEYL